MHEPLTPGTRLGRYEIVALMDAGGMGEVYRAHDAELGRAVAIKILPAAFADHPDRLRRFELEARAAAALNHPNILAVYDVGRHDGTPYIVSELARRTEPARPPGRRRAARCAPPSSSAFRSPRGWPRRTTRASCIAT